jgi:hypothetical protein
LLGTADATATWSSSSPSLSSSSSSPPPPLRRRRHRRRCRRRHRRAVVVVVVVFVVVRRKQRLKEGESERRAAEATYRPHVNEKSRQLASGRHPMLERLEGDEVCPCVRV